jgi:hypothetical protein
MGVGSADALGGSVPLLEEEAVYLSRSPVFRLAFSAESRHENASAPLRAGGCGDVLPRAACDSGWSRLRLLLRPLFPDHPFPRFSRVKRLPLRAVPPGAFSIRSGGHNPTAIVESELSGYGRSTSHCRRPLEAWKGV